MTNLLKGRQLFVFLILISPIFVWNVIHPAPIFKEWSGFPKYTQEHFSSLFNKDNQDQVNLLRINSLRAYNSSKLAKIYTYQLLIPLNAVFDYATFFSPRIYFYFQEGDGSPFYPKGVDPIPFILFPFFIWGFLFCIVNKKWKGIWLLLGLTLVAFLPGRKTFPYLFPVFLMYIYFIYIGLNQIKSSKRKFLVLVILVIYVLYLYGRLVWIPK